MNPAVDEFEKAVAATPPETWFDPGKNVYLVHDSRGQWLPLTEASYKRKLIDCGLSRRVEDGERLSSIDKTILEVQTTRNIDFAGPLAGYRVGLQEFGSLRVLVTSSPRIIEPVAGEWPTLKALIEGLLGERDGEQLPYFYGWLKIAYEALRAGAIRPGQAMAFCGPHNCGKSLLQNLITEILGGRSAKPYQAMTGGTGFNKDLFGAEHLMVEDESASTDIRARRNFGAQIKNVTVAEGQRLHAKHKDALVLRPFWRLTISLNDEEENLMVLPPMDDSIPDKVMLLRARRRGMPMPTGTVEQRQAFWGTLVSELPAFLHFLTMYEIPAELRCERFGVRHYHHPDLVQALDSSAPEIRLLALIDANEGHLWQMLEKYGSDGDLLTTAEELESVMTSPGFLCAHEARRLFSWNNACGTYLGRLAKKYPDRVRGSRTATDRRWRLVKASAGGPALAVGGGARADSAEAA